MAKKFVFALDTVERVRELHEQEAQRKVAAKRAEIAQLDQQNMQTQDEIAAQQRTLVQSQRDGALDPAGLARGRAWIAHLRNVILQREAQKQQLTQELETLSAEWREARKQLRIIQKLREKRHDAHKREQRKQEQAEMEEVVRQMQGIEPLL